MTDLELIRLLEGALALRRAQSLEYQRLVEETQKAAAETVAGLRAEVDALRQRAERTESHLRRYENGRGPAPCANCGGPTTPTPICPLCAGGGS